MFSSLLRLLAALFIVLSILLIGAGAILPDTTAHGTVTEICLRLAAIVSGIICFIIGGMLFAYVPTKTNEEWGLPRPFIV